LQPNDHKRLTAAWRKVNGMTNESMIYLSDIEFAKTLCLDRMKDNKTDKIDKPNNLDKLDKLDMIGKDVKNIIEKKSVTEPDTTMTVKPDEDLIDFITDQPDEDLIDFITDEYLDNLNRKHLNMK
jgi:hypothetical protein